jgi:hypothetical protein
MSGEGGEVMTENQDDLRKGLKKHLASGLLFPAGVGLIAATTMSEAGYKQSKADGGFVHQMPIVLHVRGGGAGMYGEFVNKYMTVEEAKLLWVALLVAICNVEKWDAEDDA